MCTCRVILDGPAPGSWNMAVDEVLLESVSNAGSPVLRLYGWQPATLSLGYFQEYAKRAAHKPSLDCDVVRRRSGGGAILHDHELTYSLVLPRKVRIASSSQKLYRAVHEPLRSLLELWRLPAQLCDAPANESAFLCFDRRAIGDLVVGTHKVLGSAQRKTSHAVLQHGSLLLRRSAFAPSLLGIQDLGHDLPDEAALKERFTLEILSLLDLRGEVGHLSAEECSAARRLETQRFATPQWLRKR